MSLKLFSVLTLSILLVGQRFCIGRIILPYVPDVVHPPTPDGCNSTENESDDSDPESLPGLFQGDIAIDNIGHSNWKVGLR